MVSVASLLNPEPPRAPLPTSRPVPVVPARPTLSFRNQPAPARPSIETLRMAEHAKPAARCKAKGVVNFPPFEVLNDAALREVRRFQVHPLGSIQDTSRRIPYNSGKKDFFSKTGREFFEVFQYDFRIPGDDTPYTIMWDYSVGLVRMTPFFKCRGYSKTTPAKMLSQNPGLKDITYSITGGAIKAQGYWMPFSCAKAVCSTFCQKIAGALIPLFGPEFPFECIPEKATGHGRMVIDPDIILLAKRDAIASFKPRTSLPSPRSSSSLSPPPQRSTRRPDPYNYHPEYERQLLLSPYITDTDADSHPRSEPYVRPLYPPMPLRNNGRHGPIAPPPTPLQSPGWTAVNHSQPYYPTYHPRSTFNPPEEPHGLPVNPTANPWLSAVPRPLTPSATNTGRYPLHHSSSSSVSDRFAERVLNHPRHGTKRGFDQVGTDSNNNDDDYDAGESNHSQAGSSPRIHKREHTVDDEGINMRAPPPSPADPPPSPTAITVAAETMVKQNSPNPNPTPMTPPTQSSTIVAHTGNITTTTTTIINNPRRASERDAAIMLMHMRGQESGDEKDSGNEHGDGCSKKVVSLKEEDGGGSGSDNGAPGKDNDDVAVDITKTEPSPTLTCSPPPPVAMEVHNPTPIEGPNTRAKRRRTLV